MPSDFEIMLDPTTYGYAVCTHCNGYGSSLKEESGQCTKCDGKGIVKDNPTKEELQLLLSSGWYRLPDPLLCMFTKEYPTAVGIKVALITLWFKATPVEGINTHYVANYESEGRNVLSTCSYYVGKFEEYLKGIDQRVDQSYARKLFLKGVSNG